MTVRGIAIVLAVALAGACASRPSKAPDRFTVPGITAEILERPPADSPVPVIEPVTLDIDRHWPHLVAVQIDVLQGSLRLRLVAGSDLVLSDRRVSLTGQNLVLLPAPSTESGKMRLDLIQPPGSGALRLRILSVEVIPVDPSTATEVANAVAADFENRTARLADPLRGNLIPNPDFVGDDEVRDTPADWLAYVETSIDPETKALRVFGTPFADRPFLESGPVTITPGRQYRARVDLRVAVGVVRIQLVDYDGRVTYDEPSSIVAAPEIKSVLLGFTAPLNGRAVRLRLAPPRPGESGEFYVHDVELEQVP